MDDSLNAVVDGTSKLGTDEGIEAWSKSRYEAWSTTLKSAPRSDADFNSTMNNDYLPELLIISSEASPGSLSEEDQKLAQSIAEVMNSDVSLDERKQQLVDLVDELKFDPDRMQEILDAVKTQLENGVHCSFEYDSCFDEYGLVLFDENAVGDIGIYVAAFGYPEGVEHPPDPQPTGQVCISF